VSVVQDSLPDARNVPCAQIPLVEFMFDQVYNVRYVQFTVLSYVGDGGGLQYLELSKPFYKIYQNYFQLWITDVLVESDCPAPPDVTSADRNEEDPIKWVKNVNFKN